MRSVNSTSRKTLALSLIMSLVLSVSLGVLGATHTHISGEQAAAEKIRHAGRAKEIAEHGHSHDEDGHHERSDGLVDSHNPADHSHETPYVIVIAFPARFAIPNVHVTGARSAPKIGAPGRLDRPPKPFS